MSERRSSGSTGSSYWVIVIAVIGVLLSLGNGFWALANPKGDIKELKDDLLKQMAELKVDFIKYQTDARWTFASKDLVNGKVDAIRDEEKTYRSGIEHSLVRIETKANGLDTEIHGVYSPKDQFTQLNARLIELERAIRERGKAPQ